MFSFNVPSKNTHLRWTKITEVTFKWFFSCVNSIMNLKMTLLGKDFLADIAHEWFFSCMSTYMSFKMILSQKFFSTVRTFMNGFPKLNWISFNYCIQSSYISVFNIMVWIIRFIMCDICKTENKRLKMVIIRFKSKTM